MPIFVTSDTLLHLYHIQFDETLREIEEREFYPDMVADESVDRALETQPLPADNADFRCPHQALTYLAIGRSGSIRRCRCRRAWPRRTWTSSWRRWPNTRASGRKTLRTAAQEWPLFRYSEDFSQYVLRGHYTRSENLKSISSV